jgi:RsiW-degrading membrane proteinase PrsW (M82 family)
MVKSLELNKWFFWLILLVFCFVLFYLSFKDAGWGGLSIFLFIRNTLFNNIRNYINNKYYYFYPQKRNKAQNIMVIFNNCIINLCCVFFPNPNYLRLAHE